MEVDPGQNWGCSAKGGKNKKKMLMVHAFTFITNNFILFILIKYMLLGYCLSGGCIRGIKLCI
jgi:hypothetical protein